MKVDDIYDAYINALLQGDRHQCIDIVNDLLATDIGIADLYGNLFQRSMYEIGEQWEHNRISVAVEHMATAITENLMVLVYPRLFATERRGLRAVISCVANEYHQIGAKMVADLLEMKGWDTYFLGASTPVSDLLAMVENKEPHIVGLSLSVFFNLHRLIEAVQGVRSVYPRLPIIVGGQAFRHGGHEAIQSLKGVRLIQSIEDIERFAEEGA